VVCFTALPVFWAAGLVDLPPSFPSRFALVSGGRVPDCDSLIPGIRAQQKRQAEQFHPIRSLASLCLNSPPAGLNRGAATREQVHDQDHQRNDQEEMNEPSGYMETETQKPQDQQKYKDRPKHNASLVSLRRLRCMLIANHRVHAVELDGGRRMMQASSL
jgi:hypothetical protein